MSGRGVGRNVPLKSDNSLVATYKYDAAGNRIEKAVNGGATERYLLSCAEQTSNGIDCWHVIATFDGSNNWMQNFVYRDEIDGVVMLEQKDVLDFDTDGNTTEITRNFYHGNALGSVMAISDMTQATAVSYRYDPYGKVTITRGGQTQTSDPLGQHWGFTGRFLDEESALWYYRARHYDATTGRFVQRDALGYATLPNLFEYARSAPYTRTDPSGLRDPDMPTPGQRESMAEQEAIETHLRILDDLLRKAISRTPYDEIVRGTYGNKNLNRYRKMRGGNDVPRPGEVINPAGAADAIDAVQAALGGMWDLLKPDFIDIVGGKIFKILKKLKKAKEAVATADRIRRANDRVRQLNDIGDALSELSEIISKAEGDELHEILSKLNSEEDEALAELGKNDREIAEMGRDDIPTSASRRGGGK